MSDSGLLPLLCRALRMLGADIAEPEQRSFNGLDMQLWPRVTWSPLFVLTFADLKANPFRFVSFFLSFFPILCFQC